MSRISGVSRNYLPAGDRARNGMPLGATHRHDLDVLQSLLRELSVQAL